MTIYNIRDFGATGGGIMNDTLCIQAAIDCCTEAGGGTVVIPQGNYLCGTIMLKSYVNFHLEATARILSSMEETDFLFLPETGRCGLLAARGAERISVSGQGIIDGQGPRFLEEDNGIGDHVLLPLIDFRPKLVDLENCSDVIFRDVTLKHASSWCLHMTGCRRVNVQAINILGQLRGPNNDGIDPDSCQDVHISDCHIEAGDDCIVLKTTSHGAKHYGPCQNITVTNCTLISRSTALKIGTETHADIRNVLFQNCTIRYTNRALGVWARDGGTIENIQFSNMIIETQLFSDELEQTRKRKWWGKGEPIFVSVDRRNEEVYPGKIRNIRFDHIMADSENSVYLEGTEDSPVENISIRGLKMVMRDKSGYPGGVFDSNPSQRRVYKHFTPAIFCRNAKRIDLDGVDIDWVEPINPNWRNVLFGEMVEELNIKGLKGGPAQQGIDAIELREVRALAMEGCRAETGTEAFLNLQLAEAGSLFMVGNDLSRAVIPYRLHQSNGASSKESDIFVSANKMPQTGS